MIHTANSLRDRMIQATDGELGEVNDIYFDDDKWAVRYLVVDTGDWLVGRRVLVSPHAIQGGPWEGQKVPVDLTREQVRNSPEIDTARPISRQQEQEYYNYYGWPYYWSGVGLWGASMAPAPGAIVTPTPPVPPIEPQPRAPEQDFEASAEGEQSHLRSFQEVLGYRIHARDGGVGHLADFLIDDETWTVHHVVVDTTDWMPGGEVIVTPSFITRIAWAEREVYVDLDRETIKSSPEFDRSAVSDK